TRWPQNAPCLIPPATPKFALAPDGVIHPPPVTKSPPLQPAGGGPASHVISACADEMTTSVMSSTLTCSALTVMSPGRSLVCSLMISTAPPSNEIFWLGSLETVTVWLFTIRVAISELPLAVAPSSVHMAVARASRKPAEMVFPATVSVTLATAASDRLALPWPTVVACTTSAVSSPGTLAFKSDASSAPPDDGRGPVSPSFVDTPSTLACTTVARPLQPVAWVAACHPAHNAGATGWGRAAPA